MPLQEEFADQGNWLFKRRGQLPIIFLIVGLIALFEQNMLGNIPQQDFTWQIICLGVAFIGLLIRAFTIGFTPRGTSGRNTKKQVAETVNTKGIYSTVRHPLYVGNFVIWLGIALSIKSWWFVFAFILMYYLYYERIMYAEENFLRHKFGQQYLDWASKTPAFIPNLSKWQANEATFSLKNVLKREYSGFLAIIVTFVFLQIVSNVLTGEEQLLAINWIYILVVSVVITLVLRSLKKYTKVLEVEGR